MITKAIFFNLNLLGLVLMILRAGFVLNTIGVCLYVISLYVLIEFIAAEKYIQMRDEEEKRSW